MKEQNERIELIQMCEEIRFDICLERHLPSYNPEAVDAKMTV